MSDAPPNLGAVNSTRRAWSNVRALDGPWMFLRRPGVWFWCAAAIGVAVRAFFVLMTEGSPDVQIWSNHASGVYAHGLIEHYQRFPLFNHPPFIGWIMAKLWGLSLAGSVPFRVLYRAPVALIDLGSAYLLLRVMAGRPERWLVCGLYCVAPCALILSAYHGNTDSTIAFSLLACTLLAARRRPFACGAVLGISVWIKLPGVLAAPAIGFSFPRWRDRIVFAASTLAVGAVTYVPTGIEAPRLLWQRVFGYRGLLLEPPDGTWRWGIKNFFFARYGIDMSAWPPWGSQLVAHATAAALSLMFVYAFIRRRDNDVFGLAGTLAASFALFYGLIDAWTFQYFAWSIPFWFVRGVPFAICANLAGGGYIYYLYAHVCGDWLLRAKWDYIRYRDWPPSLRGLRDAAVLTFLVFGLVWFGVAAWKEIRAWRGRSPRRGGA